VGDSVTVFGAADRIRLEIDNTGAQALADFKMQLKDHPSGEWYDFLSGTDWASPGDDMNFASTGLISCAAGAKAHAQVRIGSAYAFRFQAKAAAATTTVTVRGTSGATS
jgi:hypothetical protein